VADLAQGLGLDLADALARDIEVLTHPCGKKERPRNLAISRP
jgi:hypothetical protein